VVQVVEVLEVVTVYKYVVMHPVELVENMGVEVAEAMPLVHQLVKMGEQELAVPSVSFGKDQQDNSQQPTLVLHNCLTITNLSQYKGYGKYIL
jgi:hypothetical protein